MEEALVAGKEVAWTAMVEAVDMVEASVEREVVLKGMAGRVMAASGTTVVAAAPGVEEVAAAVDRAAVVQMVAGAVPLVAQVVAAAREVNVVGGVALGAAGVWEVAMEDAVMLAEGLRAEAWEAGHQVEKGQWAALVEAQAVAVHMVVQVVAVALAALMVVWEVEMVVN